TIGHDVSQPVLDRKQVRDIQVGEGTVGGQHQGYVGAGSDGVRPLHVDTGFELPVSGNASVRARASGRAVGGVDLEIRRRDERQPIQSRKNIAVGNDGVGPKGIDDDNGLTGSVQAAIVELVESI